MKTKHTIVLALSALLLVSAGGALYAATEISAPMRVLMDSYREEARKIDPGFKDFSAEQGRKLFYSTRMHSKKKEERSCTTCHTKDPTRPGRTKVGKRIEPVSPAVTKGRFSEPKKVKKWFRRNCKWVLERECTPEEKGNYITFMMSL